MSNEILRVGLLGRFSAGTEVANVSDDAWRLRKAKSLLKLLALAPERRVHVDEAAEMLWPERDAAAARNNLHQAIYAARRALSSVGLDGHECLSLQDDVISLCGDGAIRIDAIAFEEAAAAARAGRDPDRYRAALGAYDGDLLPEDRYEDWTTSRRAALHELRLALGVELAEIEAETDPAAAIEGLRDVLVADPLHEPAHRALMRLYASLGRRQEALAQFQELRDALARAVADEPDDETRRLYREILTRSGDSAPAAGAAAGAEDARAEPTAPEAAPHRIPRQLTSFVGRERELREAAGLLGTSRLLTLTGAGGAGKTRLAYELATRATADFPDGAFTVELAAIGDPALIAPALAQALGTRLAQGRDAAAALAAHIGGRRLLLVLDNCEHLVEPVAHMVEALLRRCPGFTVLATSREPLRVPGEVTWRVPSLSLPPLGPDGSADARRAESVRLFRDRARQVAPGFELDEETATVAAICHRLDGMPLAIELAAARVGALTPAQIVERLDDALDVLAGGSRTALTRQQTLRATLDWSYDLLDEEERTLLRRLSVFAGSFAIEPVEEIVGVDGLRASEALLLLVRLVDKSLVHVEDGEGLHRYRLLETVRQYAAGRLEEAGERERFARRHREWYLALAENDPTPSGDLPTLERLHALDREHDNLRAALTSGLEDDPEASLQLAVALWPYWLTRGYMAEGYRWLEAALEAAPARTPTRARALVAISLLGLRGGVYSRLQEFGSESIQIFQESGYHAGLFDAVEIATGYHTIVSGEREIEGLLREYEGVELEGLHPARPAVWAAHTRGIAAWSRREYGRAREQFELALGRARELVAEPRAALWPLTYGFISVEAEMGYPLTLQEETVIVGRRVGGRAAIAYMLVNLAAVDRAEGDLASAERLMAEALERFRRLEDRAGEGFALNAAGNLARQAGDFDRGREAIERSMALREELGDRRGRGMTLGCLATLLARAGDIGAARDAGERSRAWFAENDDLIGLSAAELDLAWVALIDGDRPAARRHLEAAAGILRGIGSHHEAWTLAVLAALAAEDGEGAAARGWLDRARLRFAQGEVEAGLAYCGQLDERGDIPPPAAANAP